ncbi:MAG: hypothetical protein H0X51_03900 [Parachlamydiaceae bacterium]|nr:hypothetical protein [Parachlamydiaceae bacterium]
MPTFNVTGLREPSAPDLQKEGYPTEDHSEGVELQRLIQGALQPNSAELPGLDSLRSTRNWLHIAIISGAVLTLSLMALACLAAMTVSTAPLISSLGAFCSLATAVFTGLIVFELTKQVGKVNASIRQLNAQPGLPLPLKTD